MRLSTLFGFVLLFAFANLLASGASVRYDRVDPLPPPTPVIKSVQPEQGKIGDVLRASGMFLDKSRAIELYFTSGTTDSKVDILEQSVSTIKFKIPAGVKPGRFHLTVRTPDDPPILLEQPVNVTVVSQ